MRFRIEQHVAAAPDRVAAALRDPAFLSVLAGLPKLGGAELLDQRDEGELVHQRVRYRFTGELNAAARAVLDPEKLTWVEESTTDTSTNRTTWRIRPDNYADRLDAHGTFELVAEAGATRRIAEGEVKVRMPLVGGKVEGAIVSGIREHAEAEEQALAAWLEAGA